VTEGAFDSHLIQAIWKEKKLGMFIECLEGLELTESNAP